MPTPDHHSRTNFAHLEAHDVQLVRLGMRAERYSETRLVTAWREMTNQDIAARIVGFIRQAAIGDALVPYEQRVDRALQTMTPSTNPCGRLRSDRDCCT